MKRGRPLTRASAPCCTSSTDTPPPGLAASRCGLKPAGASSRASSKRPRRSTIHRAPLPARYNTSSSPTARSATGRASTGSSKARGSSPCLAAKCDMEVSPSPSQRTWLPSASMAMAGCKTTSSTLAATSVSTRPSARLARRTPVMRCPSAGSTATVGKPSATGTRQACSPPPYDSPKERRPLASISTAPVQPAGTAQDHPGCRCRKAIQGKPAHRRLRSPPAR